MSLLVLDQVEYVYRTQYHEVHALKGVSASFDAGKTYALMGASGSGKTTLLSLMAGLDVPTSGREVLDGIPTSETDPELYRREKVAVIYQDFRLFPLLTAAENVMYPMELRGMKPKDAKAEAVKLLQKVGLPESVSDRFPTMLSGGEQQRVAIARALGMRTKVILADEPTGNLDEENSGRIFMSLEDLAHEDGYLVIIVTHDESIGRRADERHRMRNGQLFPEENA